MPIVSVDKNMDDLTMTVIAEFPAPVRRLWDAYVDARQIEKFWGPPTWPATFTRHDAAPNGRSEYHMAGPDGQISAGYWEWVSVDEGASFTVRDGFCNPDGEADTNLPGTLMTFAFSPSGEGSRLVTTTVFNSFEDLQQLIGMGIEQGLTSAMAQIDDVLADSSSFAMGRGTQLQLLSDTQVRVSRAIRGRVEDIWRAHHEPESLKRWLNGPDGWELVDATVASRIGDSYRYAWKQTDGDESFAFVGRLLEHLPGTYEVTTESMEGLEGPPTLNELTLTAIEGGALLSLLITYPGKDLRDTILGTGMVEGMETSYARLENDVLV